MTIFMTIVITVFKQKNPVLFCHTDYLSVKNPAFYKGGKSIIL